MSTVKSKKLQVGTDATSSNNFTIYQPATPDGTLRIGVGNADSPTEVGRFNSNGYKPQQPVAFSIYSSSNQAVTGGVNTKIVYGATTFDTSGSCSSGTFTVPVSGYYQFTGGVHMQGPNGQYFIYLDKNGVNFQYGEILYSNGTNVSASLSAFIYCNSGDAISLYGRSPTNSTFYLGSGGTYFSGILIAQG